MEVLKYDYSPNAKIYWDEQYNVVRFDWLRLFGDLERLKKMPIKAIELVEALKGDTLMIDAYNSTGILPKEILEYIFKVVNPMSVRSGVAKLLTVMPRELGFAAMSTKKWQEEKLDGQVRVNFATLEDCYEWINQQHAKQGIRIG